MLDQGAWVKRIWIIRLMQEIWNEETIKQSEVQWNMNDHLQEYRRSNNNNDKVKKDFRRRKISRWKE